MDVNVEIPDQLSERILVSANGLSISELLLKLLLVHLGSYELAIETEAFKRKRAQELDLELGFHASPNGGMGNDASRRPGADLRRSR